MFNISDLYLFQEVVKYGSFTKAASYTFITPQALAHRMKLLEEQVNTKLFNRSSTGVTLTKAGKKLYKLSPHLIEESQNMMQEVIQTKNDSKIVRIGVSTINPISKIYSFINEVLKQLPDYRIQLVPLENLKLIFPNFYQHLGEEIDLVFNPSGFASTPTETNFIKLYDLPFSVGMQTNDVLVKKEVIELSDLKNKELTLPPFHSSKKIDQFYDLLNTQKTNIKFNETDIHYTISTFNNFLLSGQYLLTFPCWDNVIPNLVTKKLNIDLTIPYGIMTPKNPNSEVAVFVETLTKIVKKAQNYLLN